MNKRRYSFISTQTIQGFSLLEVLLSVFVMSVGMMAIVAVINGSLDFSYDTRDNIIATQLAQEGVELVRNVRDNDFLTSGHDGFDNPAVFSTAEHCRISVSTGLNCQNSRENANKYYLQYSGGLYDDVSDVQGRYSRFIYINYQNNGGERATVRSFVFWGEFTVDRIPSTGTVGTCQASPNCVYTETFLTAWR